MVYDGIYIYVYIYMNVFIYIYIQTNKILLTPTTPADDPYLQK